MTVDPTDPDDAQPAVAPILARVAGEDARAADRLSVSIEDFGLPDGGRLDDRERAALGDLIAMLVTTIEREIASHVARTLGGQGGDAVSCDVPALVSQLRASGLFADPLLMAELVARTRQDLLAQAIGRTAATDDRPSLLVRLSEVQDGVVAGIAGRLLIVENRRRAGVSTGSELPAELHHKFVWWVAAALSRRASTPAKERAILDGARRSLAAHDEGERMEAVAQRLAIAIDARASELGELLVDALGDGRVALFVAIAAHAARVDFEEARALLLSRDGARLWLLLHSRSLDRSSIARIGWALAEADPRRQPERFADDLDAVLALTPDQAAAALAHLRHPAEFRAALRALDKAAR